MRFFVTRTSSPLEYSPCENAYRGSKPLEKNDWFVNINTLEELIAFKNIHGKIILDDFVSDPSIEIYDDYRE